VGKKVFGVKHSSLFAPNFSFDEKSFVLNTLAYVIQSVVLTKKTLEFWQKMFSVKLSSLFAPTCSFHEKTFWS